MQKIPAQFIVSKRPKEYLKQGRMHCGAFSVKGILSALGKDSKNDPREYQEFWLGKLFGGMLPYQIVRVLASNGVFTRIKRIHKVSDIEKLEILKSELTKDDPVILLIKNGYKPDGSWSRWQAFRAFHWITLYGYDDLCKIFYIYDSCVPLKMHDKNIPVGNIKRTYTELLRDWGLYIPWGYKNLYITL